VTEVSTIGLDIAKHVFQAHGADASSGVVFRKNITRAKLMEFLASQPRCVVALEACGGAHHWGRITGVASLGSRDRQAGPYGPADPACLRQAVRQTPEERRG